MDSLSTAQRAPCTHKTVSRCALSIPECCACLDGRPHTHNYLIYIDGVGSVPQGTRWSYYCHHCKAFWESQIHRAGISASLSRIPDFPRPSNLTEATTAPRSPGPRRTIASAFSQMEQYLTSNSNTNRTSVNRPPLSLYRTNRERERETEMSSVSGDGDSSNVVDTMRRLQRLQSLRSPDRTYSSGSEGSMDAQASTTADDPEMPAQSRNLISFVESRAQITDLENQLDRLHARMLVGRNANTARDELRRENERRRRLLPPPLRHQFQMGSRVDPRNRQETPSIAGDRSWASGATDGSNSAASLDGSSTSGVSVEPQVTTPDRTPNIIDSREPHEQSEGNTPTNNTPAERPPGRIWSLANSVQDIETELAHLSEGAARRSAELASLSQQLELQTRQYAAHRSAVEESTSSGVRDHSNILDRASEGLRQLRELRERREQREHVEQIQQVWGNVEDEDYVSPVTALFQRSWQAYNRRQQPDRESLPPPPPPMFSGFVTPADFDPIRPPLDLVTAANSASTILQSFIESIENDTITPEQQDLIDRAVEEILQMRREVRARSRNTRDSTRRLRRPRWPGPSVQRTWGEPKGLDDSERPTPLEPEAMVLDCECKVCFGQVADTVLLPCSHLVLCGWCADQMGIRKSSEFSPRTVQCPICRADVHDRIKVFRG